MHSGLFGSVALIHSSAVRRHIDGTVLKEEPGCEAHPFPLEQGVHLHRPARSVRCLPKSAASFPVDVC